MSGCLGCEVEEVNQFYPMWYHKHDLQYRPVYIEKTGKIDLDSLQLITTMDKMIRFHVCVIEGKQVELLQDMSNRAGRTINQLCSILDLDGVSLKKMTSNVVINYLQEISRIDQLAYPELLGKMMIINAPSTFSMAWRLIRGFIDERTATKVCYKYT